MSAPQSVTRVTRILEALAANHEPVGLAQLSRTLDAPKSSVAALLRGLAEVGFVVPAEGSYRLGPAAFGLGAALLDARRRLQSSDIVREGMRTLAVRTGETVLYAVRDADGDTLSYVEVVESPKAVRFAVSPGDRRPLFCTAAGRALLAATAEDEVRRYLRRLRPRRYTPGTLTAKPALAEAIAAARRAGVAQTIDQAADGVTGTAAPVRDAGGALAGALVVAAPSARLGNRRAELARQVREAALTVSRNLGYRDTGQI